MTLRARDGDRSARSHRATAPRFCGVDSGADSKTRGRIAQESERRYISSGGHVHLALAQIQLGSLDAAEQTAETASRLFPANVLSYPDAGPHCRALRGIDVRPFEQIELTVRTGRRSAIITTRSTTLLAPTRYSATRPWRSPWLTDAAHNRLSVFGLLQTRSVARVPACRRTNTSR